MVTASGPLVSVILPTYNRGEYLIEAVESVQSQTYENIELIVVDDHSDEPAANVLDRAGLLEDPAITVHRHEENRGGAAARNTGIEVADGDYLAFLDDDDVWLEAKITMQVALFEQEDENVGLVYTGARVRDGGTVDMMRPTHAGDVTRALLCQNVIGSLSAVMVDPEVVDKAGRLDHRFPSWQDHEWYIRLSRHCTVEPIPSPLIRYRKETDGITDNIEQTINRSYPLFVEKYASVAAEYGGHFERKMRAWAAYEVGALLADDEQYERASRYFGRAARLYPYEPWFVGSFLAARGGEPVYQCAKTISGWFGD